MGGEHLVEVAGVRRGARLAQQAVDVGVAVARVVVEQGDPLGARLTGHDQRVLDGAVAGG